MSAAAEAEEQRVGAEVRRGSGWRARRGRGVGGKVDGAVVLVDLDGVAAAEGDVGAGAPARWVKLRMIADGALGIGGGGGDLGALIAPEIEGEQGAADEMRLAGEELESLGGPGWRRRG